MNLASLVVGPLFVPECRRSARKGWLPIVRALAALAAAAPAVLALWWWWLNAKIDPEFRVDTLVPVTLGILVGLATTIALVLAPAILAGSLAGELEKGTIGLLLSTRVDAREIVAGRMLGKLSQVAAILLATWPFVVGFGVLAGWSFPAIVGLLAFPLCVGLGSGGLAIAVSAVARKGRNALMVIYLAQVLLLLAPALGLVPGMSATGGYLGVLNPYSAIGPMLASGSIGPGLSTMLAWLAFALAGTAFAAWRLRPAFLGSVGGRRAKGGRPFRVPPVEEARPMIWKELYIERVGVLGWFGRTLAVLVVAFLALGSLVLAALALFWLVVRPDPGMADRTIHLMHEWYTESGPLVAALIELAIGLRAAVAVASERERNTWDALLTSPLEGREIVRGKLWGSVYALRWLIGAALLAWGITAAFGAMPPSELASLVGQTATISAFMAAIGVRISLACGSGTRAMTITAGVWLGSLIGIAFLALMTMLLAMLVCFLCWLGAMSVGWLPPGGRPWLPGNAIFGLGFAGIMGATYLSLTLAALASTRRRFDELAGRNPGDGRTKPRHLPPSTRKVAAPADSLADATVA